MIVERKRKREFWMSTLLNGLPDIVIAGMVALVTDGGLLMFFGVFIGLKAVYLAVWLKNSIWFWIRYKIRDRRLILQRLLDFLIENKFPKPGELVDSAENYLEEVAADETVEVKTRLLAAAELGAFQYLRASMRSQEYARLSMPYDDAVEEYARIVRDT